MPSAAELKNTLRTELDRVRAAEEAIALARAELAELAELETATIEGIPATVLGGGRTSIEHFIRMVFSALVDADFLDTEAHFNTGRTDGRTGNDRSMADLLARFLAYYEKRFSNAEGTLAGLRREIFEACLVASEAPPGFFRLAVPTGGGKTLAGLVFALQHAVHHGKRRVIFAVPYLSITEQTAAVYREIFPEDGTVLEHHSGFHESGDEEYASGAVMWSRLAAENWDAPVIVTTTVQLLESLFAHRPSRARKLHNIAGSVIVLDEVQSLPGPLLTPTLDMLRELVDHYGVTVVFSSATQPAYEVLKVFSQVSATPIVPEPDRYYRALKRVTYEARLDHRPPWDEVAGWLADEPQALAIVNTKKDALALLDALDAAGVTDALHLSTLLCGAHRSDTIEEVRRRLRDKEPCIVVSTQVVEAGVDLDFPAVYRALAPLEAIIQAAGRCNREGKLDRGRVVIFDPAEGGLPSGDGYRMRRDQTRPFIERGDDLNSLEVVERYYRDALKLLHKDPREIQKLRAARDYPEVARRYRLIEDDTESVVVTNYGTAKQRSEVARLLEEARVATGNARWVMRQLQPFVIAVHHGQVPKLQARRLIDSVFPGLHVLDERAYDEKVRGFNAGAEADLMVV